LKTGLLGVVNETGSVLGPVAAAAAISGGVVGGSEAPADAEAAAHALLWCGLAGLSQEG
jgi:hypothetical protein